MILTCPACSARFEVDESAIGPEGRRLRCGVCAHEWRQLPAEAAEAAVAAGGVGNRTATPAATAKERSNSRVVEKTVVAASATPSTSTSTAAKPPERPASPASDAQREPERQRVEPILRRDARKGRGGGTATLVIWVILLVLIAAIAVGLFLGREQVVARFPETQPLYESIGIEVSGVGLGLTLQNVTSVRTVEAGTPVLVVEGEIRNRTNKPLDVPALEARVVDVQGNVILDWTFEAENRVVEPGETTAFQTRSLNPPEEATDLKVRFVSRDSLP